MLCTTGTLLNAGGGRWKGTQEPYFLKAISSPMAYHYSLFSGVNYWLIRLSKEEAEREKARENKGEKPIEGENTLGPMKTMGTK